MRTRVVMICGLALATAATLGGICGDPAPPNAGQTPTPGAATVLPRPTVSAERISEAARKVTSFDQFPLVWLGTSYDSGVGDLPLSGAYYLPGEALVNPRTGAEILPAIRSFNLAYGSCQIPPGRDECTIALGITIYPADQKFPPRELGTRVRVRGVDALDEDGSSLFFETADFQVEITAWGDQAIRIANMLEGANALAAGITAGSDFRPKGTATPPVPASTAVSNPPCCSLRLDLDPTSPGVQSSLAVSGAQDINIDVVLDGKVGNVSAFNFTLIYDDTQLTPAGAKDGALDGNPDFNQAALGTAWNCSSAGSPSPDVDPAAGAGRGAALLSCYAQSGGTALTAATVVGTLRLHASAPVAASVQPADVYFAHDDGAEIGSCNPIITVEMTCAGGAVVPP